MEATRTAHSSSPPRVTVMGSSNYDFPHDRGIPLADVIVAFDSTFSPSTSAVTALRQNPAVPDALAPIIYPMIFGSIEHLQRCLPPMRSPLDRLEALTRCVLQTRHQVGELQPEDHKPDSAAEEVAEFIEKGGSPDNWTLFKMRTIRLSEYGFVPATQLAHILSEPGKEAINRKRQVVSRDTFSFSAASLI